MDIVAKVSGNRTDLVKLVHASTSGPSEIQKYMLCDFEKCKMLLKSHSLIKLFLKTSFIFGEGVSESSDIVAQVSGNRTDLVELVHASTSGPSEVKKYMVCDFSKWEKRSQHSKRDHCKIFFGVG